MMQNPQAVNVGARLARRLVMAVVLPAAARSPDAVAFCGGLLAGIAGGIAGAIGPMPCAELLRIALARIEGTPQLELPPGVRLQLAQAEASEPAAANDEPDQIKATDQERAAAFEWLRGVALGTTAPYVDPGVQRLAAIALQELAGDGPGCRLEL